MKASALKKKYPELWNSTEVAMMACCDKDKVAAHNAAFLLTSYVHRAQKKSAEGAKTANNKRITKIADAIDAEAMRVKNGTEAMSIGVVHSWARQLRECV